MEYVIVNCKTFWSPYVVAKRLDGSRCHL